MKKIKVKRLIYSHIETGEILFGGEEYDGHLSDDNILCSVHEIGKTKWLPTHYAGFGDGWTDELWLLIPDTNNPQVKYPKYRITIDDFYRYEKTQWDLLCDRIKRILRI